MGENSGETDDGGVERDQDINKLPWCPNCEAYSVPTGSGICGDCGSAVEYLEDEP